MVLHYLAATRPTVGVDGAFVITLCVLCEWTGGEIRGGEGRTCCLDQSKVHLGGFQPVHILGQ